MSSGPLPKFSPLIVTRVPGGPSLGETPVTIGGNPIMIKYSNKYVICSPQLPCSCTVSLRWTIGFNNFVIMTEFHPTNTWFLFNNNRLASELVKYKKQQTKFTALQKMKIGGGGL